MGTGRRTKGMGTGRRTKGTQTRPTKGVRAVRRRGRGGEERAVGRAYPREDGQENEGHESGWETRESMVRAGEVERQVRTGRTGERSQD